MGIIVVSFFVGALFGSILTTAVSMNEIKRLRKQVESTK